MRDWSEKMKEKQLELSHSGRLFIILDLIDASRTQSN